MISNQLKSFKSIEKFNMYSIVLCSYLLYNSYSFQFDVFDGNFFFSWYDVDSSSIDLWL